MLLDCYFVKCLSLCFALVFVFVVVATFSIYSSCHTLLYHSLVLACSLSLSLSLSVRLHCSFSLYFITTLNYLVSALYFISILVLLVLVCSMSFMPCSLYHIKRLCFRCCFFFVLFCFVVIIMHAQSVHCLKRFNFIDHIDICSIFCLLIFIFFLFLSFTSTLYIVIIVIVIVFVLFFYLAILYPLLTMCIRERFFHWCSPCSYNTNETSGQKWTRYQLGVLHIHIYN